MPIAPAMRKVLRPNLSRKRTAGSVKVICRIPVTPVASRVVLVEEKPNEAKI
jgi:hypothetical protein